MKISDLREKSDSELRAMDGELKRELWKARFANFTNQLDDTAKLKRLRQRIAQVKTLLGERSRKQAGSQA